MKKLLVIVAVVLSAGTLSAQKYVEFGAKAGLNFASLSGEDTEGLDGVTSFHLGLVAEFPLTDKFSIQPEVLYSGLGASTSSDHETWKLDYITVPVILKYYVLDGLALEAGSQVGFLVKAEMEYDYKDDIVESGTRDISDEIKNIDFAVAGGLSYELPIGLFFSGRYNLGLVNVGDDPQGWRDLQWKNRVLQLSVGYKF